MARFKIAGIDHKSRRDYYRIQAQECLAASRACSDQKGAAQLAVIAANYFDRAELLQQALHGTVRFGSISELRAHIESNS
jgi:hypothetical protein